ncbi:methyltransferase, FkbM family [Thiorhodovibrio winogradskyi]|uniref:Methyltransferase, FkbM family n=1 Tax=Thiorhodovibrio winogradskyi TaxID=77007 RepID=A0ABZ0SAX9_9GAMM|nr:hypothetical protein [Thiorhodovibrio winogradskyi]
MFRIIASRVLAALPALVRKTVWWVTDAEWRREFGEVKKRIRVLKKRKIKALQKIYPQTRKEVISGPFQGIKFADRPFRMKILGTYEKELHQCFEQINGKPYDLIVDIGAAEGYYVVGLARMFPEVPVIAFEANPKLHRACLELCKLNDCLDRITIKGLCGPEDLIKSIELATYPFILCDIEGAEWEVLNPELNPDLYKADLIVEIHEDYRAGVEKILLERFEKSHCINIIPSVDRTLSDFPTEIILEDDLKLAAMDETRCKMSWFCMHSRR